MSAAELKACTSVQAYWPNGYPVHENKAGELYDHVYEREVVNFYVVTGHISRSHIAQVREQEDHSWTLVYHFSRDEPQTYASKEEACLALEALIALEDVMQLYIDVPID